MVYHTDESRYPDTFTVILKLGFLDSVSSTEW